MGCCGSCVKVGLASAEFACMLCCVLMVAGDPIEVGAATSVLQPGKDSSYTTHHLLLSGWKSEAGHSEPAAGVLGLLRLAAQVSKRTLRQAGGVATTQLVTSYVQQV